MQAELFLKNKIKRQILWNGQDFEFIRYEKDNYKEKTNEVKKVIKIRGIYHDGGGYGGMLNIEIYNRDGGRTITKMKPMILCLYSDNTDERVLLDDVVKIGETEYKVVEKNNIKNMNIAFEISLEAIDGRKR